MKTEPFRVESVDASAYTIPTDAPEADGTFAWNDTTLVLVQVRGDGRTGTGWTYGSPVTAALIVQTLAPLLVGRSFADVTEAWTEQVIALRNIGRPGIGSMAVSAVDCALWDLSARLVDQPLHQLLGAVRDRIPLYGSGGFTTYTTGQLADQLTGWGAEGFPAVKIKIGEGWGSNDRRDLNRITQARDLIGPDVELFVDANGAYTRSQALRLAPIIAELGVTWFEEPVSSDDLHGLHLVREAFRGDVAAGEYGYDLAYFRHVLDASAVDCLQVDVTRCGGITELVRIAALAQERGLQISGHCAPHQHADVLAAVANLRHVEWFHDHVRIEQMLFDRTACLTKGELHLDEGSPGNGLTWRAEAAEPYRVA
ncbi:MAG TPA: enolase C-terminal domain-like protein [Microlunatus sp.]|nr:enolase C-terminal domain-like protein [Microlunatus sp.]